MGIVVYEKPARRAWPRRNSPIECRSESACLPVESRRVYRTSREPYVVNNNDDDGDRRENDPSQKSFSRARACVHSVFIKSFVRRKPLTGRFRLIIHPRLYFLGRARASPPVPKHHKFSCPRRTVFVFPINNLQLPVSVPLLTYL